MRKINARPGASVSRLRLAVRGAVQGVGFRPFVFRLANDLGLAGWVNNSPQGVSIEVEGRRDRLENFRCRLEAEKPAHSFLRGVESSWLTAAGYEAFEIRASDESGSRSALVLPDLATCPDCRRETFDPGNRRFRYPFTNCTHCGPRFSIIEALPYDRANTSMRGFKMCPACRAEYENPRDRRFHAQPNACPICGPQLELWDVEGKIISKEENALPAAIEAIRRGKIVAVKGLGGFHLLVDARNESAVQLLRERKHRGEKPFALMFPSLESVRAVCEVSALEERLLLSPAAPIVLLRKIIHPHPRPLPGERGNCSPVSAEVRATTSSNELRNNKDDNDCSLSLVEKGRVRAGVEPTDFEIAPSISPGNPNLGVMFPSNPLHHLLMAELNFPVVATSGNLSDEPICTDEHEALERLRGIADLFLMHNRPIVRPEDDSIVRAILDREMILRRARGYAPLPIQFPVAADARRLQSKEIHLEPPHVGCFNSILAVGAHLKNAVALAVGENVIISQHIGDLDTEPAYAAFCRACEDLPAFYKVKPEIVAVDLHPDYLSTRFALERRLPARSDSGNSTDLPAGSEAGAPEVVQVQHHVAHVMSCLAENEVRLPALGIAWDGTGYGKDGTIWGGEFFRVTETGVERVAHLRPFRLPGGEKAVKQPRRVALALLYELYGEAAFEMDHLPPLRSMPPVERMTFKGMLQRQFHSPITSSLGRLFDGVASLINLRQRMDFEGQAAMELEFAVDGVKTNDAYSLPIQTDGKSLVLDWADLIHEILVDVNQDVRVANISAKFHNALAEAVVAVAKKIGEPRVALSGGCFQNLYLTERMVNRLRAEHFQPYWHQRVPPNDGGIALGQVYAVRNNLTLK